MRKALISTFLFAAFHATAQSEEINVAPHIAKAGQLYTLTVTNEKATQLDGKIVKSGTGTTPVKLKIVPTAGGLIEANWKYGPTKVSTMGKEIEMSGVDGASFDMMFNDHGQYQGLKDFKKTRSEYVRHIKATLKDDSNAMNEAIQKMTSDEEAFTTYLMREPVAYFFPWGVTFNTKKPIEYKTDFNVLGYLKIPVAGKIVTSLPSADGKLTISGTQKADTKIKDKGASVTLAMRESSTYVVDLTTGMVEKYSMQRVNKTSDGKSTRTEEQRLEITLNK